MRRNEDSRGPLVTNLDDSCARAVRFGISMRESVPGLRTIDHSSTAIRRCKLVRGLPPSSHFR